MPWDRLTEIEYEEGEPLPPRVRGLDGERVVMAGYFVRTAYGELLLVKSVWSCCFGQPPAVHEAVVVSLEGPPEDEWLDGLIRVAGTLEVGEERDEGYVVSVYRMRADRVDVLR